MAIVIVLGYILITSVIGVARKGKFSSTSEMFIAKGDLGLLLIVPLLFGEVIAGASVTGTAQGGYSQGISAIWVFVGKGLSCVVVALVLSKFYSDAGKAGVMSVPEAFKWRFNTGVRYVMVFIVLMPMTMVCSAQCKAAASLLSPMLGIDTGVLVVATAVLFCALALSGLRGIAKMNVVHSLMIFFGVFIVMVVCVASQGGVAEVLAKAPPSHSNLLYPSVSEILGQFVSAILAFCIAVTPANACFSNPREGVNKKGLIIAGILAAVFSFFPAFIGLSGAVALPGIDGNTILYRMPETISPALSGLASMAVLAAVLSTAPFLFLAFPTVLVRDIVIPIKGDVSEKSQLTITRVSLVAFTCFVLFLSFNSIEIFSQFVGANHIKAVGAFALLLGISWKRLTNRAVFWSMLVTGVLSTYWYFSGSVFGLDIEPLWPALALEFLIMVAVTFADKKGQFRDYELYVKRNDEANRKFEEHQAGCGEGDHADARMTS